MLPIPLTTPRLTTCIYTASGKTLTTLFISLWGVDVHWCKSIGLEIRRNTSFIYKLVTFPVQPSYQIKTLLVKKLCIFLQIMSQEWLLWHTPSLRTEELLTQTSIVISHTETYWRLLGNSWRCYLYDMPGNLIERVIAATYDTLCLQ